MNFEYSKTKKQKQEMIKKNIEKKHQITNQLNNSNLLLKNNPSNASEHLDLFSNLLDVSNDEPSNLNEENTVIFSIKNIDVDAEQSTHFSNSEVSNHNPLNYSDTSSVDVLFNNSTFSTDSQIIPSSIINHRELGNLNMQRFKIRETKSDNLNLFTNSEVSNHISLNYIDTNSENVLFNNSQLLTDSLILPSSIITHKELRNLHMKRFKNSQFSIDTQNLPLSTINQIEVGNLNTQKFKNHDAKSEVSNHVSINQNSIVNNINFLIKNVNLHGEKLNLFNNVEASNHGSSNDTKKLPLSIINHREVIDPIINPIIKINKTTKNNPTNPILNIKHNIKIINIYQTNYINGNAQGLGDFLRGSYYLMQFCEKYNYIYEVDLSRHILCNFIKKFNKYENKQRENLNNIYKFDNINSEFLIGEKSEIQFKISNNYKLFEKFLKKQKIVNDTISLYTNSFPILPIKNEDKKYMRSILEPTDEIIETSKKVLERIDLMNKPFTIIHIRYGDDYLVHNEKKFNLENLEKLKSEINDLPKSENYLLLADNNPVKRYIIKQFPFIKTFFKEISHSGEKVNEINKIKNTMVEFYLMSYSKKILNYSSYLHGSGFSKWCAVTYDVPYKSKYINSLEK